MAAAGYLDYREISAIVPSLTNCQVKLKNSCD